MNIQFLNHNDHIWRQCLQDDAYLEEEGHNNKKPCHMRNLKGLGCWDKNVSVKSELFSACSIHKCPLVAFEKIKENGHSTTFEPT